MKNFIWFVLIWLVVMGKNAAAQDMKDIRYVALGDSYTIGMGATVQESWPALLTRHLQENGIPIKLVENLGQGGWTTADVIKAQIPVYQSLRPTFASILIGTNDWVQGMDASTYRQQVATLLDQMLAQLPGKNRLLVVTSPDFSVAPNGPYYSSGRNITDGMKAFNDIVKEEAYNRGLTVVDLYETTKQFFENPSFISSDGLHPSAQGYGAWEKLIYPVVVQMLTQK